MLSLDTVAPFSACKVKIKHVLSEGRFFSILDLIRRLPESILWAQRGCGGVAPSPIKRKVLDAYLKQYGLTEFIETGTYLGDTLAYMGRHRHVRATSIELDADYYQAAKRRFAKYLNITLLHGDSGDLLPELVSGLNTPTLFWLDGHFSGGKTAKGKQYTPISLELQAILDSSVKGHVILIDDARCFDGSHGYPHLDRLLEFIRTRNTYNIEVSADIIRLTPKI